MTDEIKGKRSKEELLDVLEGEIFAAQMKVILDKELGRETSPTVKKLAELKLPPRPRKPSHSATCEYKTLLGISEQQHSATKFVLRERERELLELKGVCSTTGCPLHYAHFGPCNIK